jgi:hypothetical protein
MSSIEKPRVFVRRACSLLAGCQSADATIYLLPYSLVQDRPAGAAHGVELAKLKKEKKNCERKKKRSFQSSRTVL